MEMAAIYTLSDSDDSDDLPSFADRVKRMIDAEKEEVNRKCSPLKRNTSQIHSISDSEDSRDTIPINRERSTSPICISPVLPKFNFGRKNDTLIDKDLPDDKRLSPDLGPVIRNNRVNENDDSWNLGNHSPVLNHKTDSLSSLPSLSSNPELDLNMKDPYLSSDKDSPVKKVTKKVKEKRDNKDAEKEMKKKIRLEKQKEKELMKALKASEKEILKNKKPEECLKRLLSDFAKNIDLIKKKINIMNMIIALDHALLDIQGFEKVLNMLGEKNLLCSMEGNLCKYSVNWYRKVINISTENGEILRQERGELADTVVVVIPNADFLKMVHAYVQKERGRSSDSASLAEFVISIKSLYPGCFVTCVTIGFAKYMKSMKDEGSPELKSIAKQIHKNSTEEAIIELQLQSPINFKFLDDVSEFGSLLHHFTKAVAEAPQRREKQVQKALAFSWYAENDSHCPIKLAKDRSSFIKLWRQQIQQFQNVSQEVAEAIVSHYPSPRLLLKAYNSCFSTKDAENLLQDIVVRRNYGPLGTQKRIGPELSYKLFTFFTSRIGNKLLKR